MVIGFKKLLNIFLVSLFIQVQTSRIRGQEISNLDLFENKNILITGGTGYLGRSIASELLKYNPKKIVIFSRDEVKHFNVAKLLGYNPKIKNVIGDIRDYDNLLKHTKNMDIVFHTAALKRADMLEENVEQAIKTNIIGVLNVFNACVANNVKKALYISTDKACCPVNAYGGSKFVSEKLFTNYDRKTINTTFLAARFGNILESTGSIIPIFSEKINAGENIPLTDTRMTRFIVDKQEAVELIFDALRYGIGGEIFVRKLPSLKITDLIDVLKDKFHSESKVVVTGLRPGEKLHEELINRTEIPRTFDFGNYYVITPNIKDWLSDIDSIPVYMKGKKFMNEKIMNSFNSEQALISKQEIATLFQKFGILAENQ
ncbi:MAG: SDR family NAD(P)-dependent oxidoreductase [Candidatus Babeliales bacterium]|jgi:FlaA1/EpsC-like NDP-sugar epimerase